MPAPVDYKVTQVIEVVIPLTRGGFERRTRVHYQLPNGYEGQVEVVTTEATPERVRETVETDARRVLAIYGAKGG